MTETFEQFIERERERLNDMREDALAKLKEAEVAMEEIDAQLEAVRAYETVRRGTPYTFCTPPDEGETSQTPGTVGKGNHEADGTIGEANVPGAS